MRIGHYGSKLDLNGEIRDKIQEESDKYCDGYGDEVQKSINGFLDSVDLGDIVAGIVRKHLEEQSETFIEKVLE